MQDKIQSDLEYLHRLDHAVKSALDQGIGALEEHIGVRDCGKSHVLLNGLVQQLHRQNVRALVKEYQGASDTQEKLEGSQEWQQKTLI